MRTHEAIKRFGLTNTETAALYLMFRPNSRGHEVRKAMFKQRFCEEPRCQLNSRWTRGWYSYYFMDGTYAQCPYARSQGPKQLWQSTHTNGVTTWALTHRGYGLARKALTKVPYTQLDAFLESIVGIKPATMYP